MQMYKKKAKPTIYNAIKMKNVFFRQIIILDIYYLYGIWSNCD